MASQRPRPPRQVRRGAAPTPPLPSKLPGSTGISGISLKRMIWTGAFAAVTIVGAIYGAGLKTQQEFKEEKKKIIEASPEDRIQGLEDRRAMLLRERAPLERKLDELRARMRAQEIKDAAAAGNGGAGTDGGKK
ncbi:hypothetical protein F5Y13DRAFT_81624 [Hypoxylon sp. FL1857]|nr:hypothetical protein F5Y13DRAFT_81624 [Hypoxylon sp. FL1857]